MPNLSLSIYLENLLLGTLSVHLALLVSWAVRPLLHSLTGYVNTHVWILCVAAPGPKDDAASIAEAEKRAGSKKEE